jgi:excisionase family DNA binding protein
MTTHDDLCAIPNRVTTLEYLAGLDNIQQTDQDNRLTTLEETVARLDLWVTELLKQVAQLRQQQIVTATRPETVPRLGYTITETAAALNLTRTQVYELIAAGRLHPISIGVKGQRIPADQLDRLLHPQEKAPI